MINNCQLKINKLSFMQVLEDNLEEVEQWCGGSIKGIKLPRRDRVIKVWSKLRQTELEASVGDYIVEIFPNVFEVYPYEMFTVVFEEVE